LRGYKFTTTSDTEVVLALYEKYGYQMAEKLPGMFALAIWDEKKDELICFRDRFGEKPFYYARGKNGEFIFASEIKAILKTGLVRPIIDPASLSHYLQYLYVPKDKSIYSNIHVLPPAHGLVFSKGKLKIWKYWAPGKITQQYNLDEAAEHFEILFRQAVSRQLIADVPVGALLSGGLDSSSVIAIASQQKANLSTFSFGFEGGRNELSYAREAAKKYKTNHHEFYEKDIQPAELILKMAQIYDDPFADSSNIPTYLISKLASKYVKVALTGDGGDELLGGYSGWYKPLFFQSQKNHQDWVSLLLLQASSIGHTLLSKRIPRTQEYKLGGLKFKLAGKSLGWAHNRQLSRFSPKELQLLNLAPVKDKNLEKAKTLEDIMRHDAENYMPADILVKTDRASMASGLELRAPFLDVDLASFCLSLPYQLKMDEATDKLVLRKAFARLLPAKILNREKQGFGSPVSSWLKNPAVIDLKTEYLLDKNSKIYHLLPYAAVNALSISGGIHEWIFLNLAIWADSHTYEVRS
jgi:asparagine synthase (glutamine-hydrolysing)